MLLNQPAIPPTPKKGSKDRAISVEITGSVEKSPFKLRIIGAFTHFNWEDHNLQPALEGFGQVIRLKWHPHNHQI